VTPPLDENEQELAPDNLTPTRPHVRQLALQCAAAFLVLALAWPYFGIRNQPLPWAPISLTIGGVALLIASFTRQAWWWRLIHALFAPLVFAVSWLAIDPGWFLLALVVSLLVYRGALTGQIPLFLSNKDTVRALAGILSKGPGPSFIDLGAGIGSVLVPLSVARPDACLSGIENAPAPWFIGYLRVTGRANCRWLWGSIWSTNLGEYDVVYAFLSPAAMPALWEKVRAEMRPGSVFVSNSFPVPDGKPSDILDIDDARHTRLYCYRR
jgi:hypothetical protein